LRLKKQKRGKGLLRTLRLKKKKGGGSVIVKKKIFQLPRRARFGLGRHHSAQKKNEGSEAHRGWEREHAYRFEKKGGEKESVG